MATDLDGTLVRSDDTVSARSRRVLEQLDARGVPVVFVTARPLRWMEDLWAAVGAHGLAVVSNGAVVFDVTARAVREVRGIGRDEGLPLVEAIRGAIPTASFALECVDGIRRDEAFVEAYRVPPGSPVGPLEELWTDPVLKLLVRDPGSDPSLLQERVVAAVGDRATPTWSVPGLVEISARGVTKATALARLAEELGVEAAQVLALGDMPNDLPMLRWAGTSYAMGNAHPSVLEAADHVAPTNDDDGVARVLASVFGLGD